MNINIWEFLEKIQNGEKDFSNIRISPIDRDYIIEKKNLAECDFSNSTIDRIIFYECNLE